MITEDFRMLIWGHGISTARSFSIITFEETLDVHLNITTTFESFSLINPSQFPISSILASSVTISNYTITRSSLTSYTIEEVLSSDQFESDVSYWLRDYYAYNLTHNTYLGNFHFHSLELNINLTCSSGGSVVSLDAHNADGHAFDGCKRSKCHSELGQNWRSQLEAEDDDSKVKRWYKLYIWNFIVCECWFKIISAICVLTSFSSKR